MQANVQTGAKNFHLFFKFFIFLDIEILKK